MIPADPNTLKLLVPAIQDREISLGAIDHFKTSGGDDNGFVARGPHPNENRLDPNLHDAESSCSTSRDHEAKADPEHDEEGRMAVAHHHHQAGEEHQFAQEAPFALMSEPLGPDVRHFALRGIGLWWGRAGRRGIMEGVDAEDFAEGPAGVRGNIGGIEGTWGWGRLFMKGSFPSKVYSWRVHLVPQSAMIKTTNKQT